MPTGTRGGKTDSEKITAGFECKGVGHHPHVHLVVYSCCYPSIGTVARELQLSRRTVERAIDDLVRAGLITKTVLAGERWAEQPAFYSERPLNLKKEMPPRGKCALLAA